MTCAAHSEPAEPVDPRVARSRAAVLGATLDLLTADGFAGLSIDAIAKRSGVARTTIYRHWPSLAAIVQDAASSTVSPTPLSDTGDARTDLRAHLGALAAKLTSSDWGRLLPVLVDAAGRDPEILELQRRSTTERRKVALDVVRRGIEAGQLRDDVDFELLSEMLVGAVFTRRLVNHLPIDDEFLDELIDLAFRIAGPAA